ncbi:hypothetical protein V2J09_008567 [Rumex salicifolius]
MVSFQASLSLKNLDQQRTISYLEPDPSKKRKWNHLDDPYDHYHNHPCTIKPSSAIDLHLETPLPSEWQRCLDIQSGEIYFYNTKTKKRTMKDPRHEVQRPSSHMSLDLELNLPCGDDHVGSRVKPKTLSLFTATTNNNNSSISPVVEAEEMVAAACKKCHMLVVLCKSSPSCPNCKFMHPLDDQSLPSKFMIKPDLGLSC